MDKKILLIGPYNKDLIRTGQYLSPPLGVYRIASYIEQKNLAKVDVADPTLDYADTINKISKNEYAIIGHSILHPTIEEDIKLIWDANKSSPNSIQIAGGQGAYFNRDQILKKTPIKAIARGFGESVLEKIIKNGFRLENLENPFFERGILNEDLTRDQKEFFKEITLKTNFEKIPYKNYWNLMGNTYNEKQTNAMKNKGMTKTIRLMVSNYCPLGCSHCTSTNFQKGQKLTFLEPEEIVRFMDEAKKAHPSSEAFYFNDDNFLMMGKNKISELSERILSGNQKENLMFQGRVDEVGKETLMEMKKANFKIGFYGVETFSNDLAGIIRKRKGNSDYQSIARKAIEDTLETGMNAQFSLMFFLPETTEKDLEITIDNSLDLMEKGARVTIFPYVEAYSGADILLNHNLTYKSFEAGGEKFSFSDLVLPNDQKIINLARESLTLKQEFNSKDKWKSSYSGQVPQPVDSLNLFLATSHLIGKPTSKIENMLEKYT